jgi:hypothetical protein
MQRAIALRRSGESDIVPDDRRRPDGKRLRIGDVELGEPKLVPPHLPQKILEDLDRELFSWAAALAEAEGRETGMVADR